MSRSLPQRRAPAAGELAGVLTRLPAYARLAWALARDRRLPAAPRLLLILGSAYSLSPIDVIPGFIPGVGQLDDLAALLAGLRRALEALPEAERRAHLARAGVDSAQLIEDERRVRAALAALLASAGRTGVRAAARAGRAALRVAGWVGRAAWRALRRTAGRARRGSGSRE